MEINRITGAVIDSAMKVHSAFGPGLLESAYKACLVYELRERGLRVDVEVGLPLIYAGVRLADVGYRIDLLVEHEVVVELKGVEINGSDLRSAVAALSQAQWKEGRATH
jgi:GxxExxY protein